MSKKLTLLLIISTFVFSCRNQAPKSVVTEKQKQEIKKEIELRWEVAREGIEQLDAQKAFSAWSTNANAKYLREGHLYESIASAEKQYSNWMANSPGNARLTFDPMIYDILSEELVIVTAIGKHVFTDSTDNEYTTIIGYSVVWQKEAGNWKIFNMHTSIK